MPYCPSCGSHHSQWSNLGSGASGMAVEEPHAPDGLNAAGGASPKPMSGVGPTERPVKAEGPPPLPRK